MAISESEQHGLMTSAPIQSLPDALMEWALCGTASVPWREGGPPHRSTRLCAQEDADTVSEGYQFAVAEIIRGIAEVSGLAATPAQLGWMAVCCRSASIVQWLAESIKQENVQVQAETTLLFVPAGDHFTLKGEIKNVITIGDTGADRATQEACMSLATTTRQMNMTVLIHLEDQFAASQRHTPRTSPSAQGGRHRA